MMMDKDAAEAFLAQNTDMAEGLTEDDLATVEEYAEHHAGGLFVLWRYVDDNLSVKAHDSWGDDGIVVHVYSTEDDSHDVVNYYATGHEAIAAFLTADATTEEK